MRQKLRNSHQTWQYGQFSFWVQKGFDNTTYLIPFAFLKPSGKKIRITQFQQSTGKFIMFPEGPQ